MRPLVTLFGAYNAQLGGTMKLYKVIHRALISTAVFGALTIPAKADVDMSGKIIEWTIPFSETGGSAKWANFFAPLLSEALPGNPTVVVKFMPGAGSTKGANWFQEQKNGELHFVYHTQFLLTLGPLLGFIWPTQVMDS